MVAWGGAAGGGVGTAREAVPRAEACGRSYGGAGSSGYGGAGRRGGTAVAHGLGCDGVSEMDAVDRAR